MLRYERRFKRSGEGGMDLDDATGTQERFRAYAADLASAVGHADRVRPFEDYCIGLLSAEGRKSVEPLAAVTAPERTAAQHQSLLHLVAQAPWSDQAVLARVRERVLPSITRDEAVQAWIIDDTGFPKKGSHSVGVARQYCGQVGKQDNCQVAVCRWPLTRAVCRSTTGCIYPRSGPTIRSAGRSPACLKTSASRPNRRLRCNRCVRPRQMACHPAWR